MLTKLWRILLRRLGLQRLLRRSWAPAAAAAVVLLTVLLGLGGVVVSCSSLGGKPRGHGRPIALEQGPDVRVRIRKGPGAMQIDGHAPLLVGIAGARATRVMTGPLVVVGLVGGLSITDAAGGAVQSGAGIDIEVTPGTAPGATKGSVAATFFRADGTDYPGTLLLHPRSEDGPDAFDGIAVMPIEQYLPGVVAHEMLARWPKGAYQVQAVCARTYALHDRDRARKAGRPFDVESTTQDQMFGGVATNPVIVDAVQSTRGMVVTWAGGLLRAYYSSTCGGRPGTAASVWPIGPGYEFNMASPLQGGARATLCEGSAAYTWEVSRGVDDVSQRLRSWGRYAGHPIKSAGRIRSVEVAAANGNGRPVSYRVVDVRGKESRVTAEEFRVACNWPAEGLPAVTRANRIGSSDLQVEARSGQFRFKGRGLGHGIGMCQWCAKAMADRGQDWKSMISQFYPGAGVERHY